MKRTIILFFSLMLVIAAGVFAITSGKTSRVSAAQETEEESTPGKVLTVTNPLNTDEQLHIQLPLTITIGPELRYTASQLASALGLITVEEELEEMTEETEEETEESSEVVKAEKAVTVDLLAVGDMLMHVMVSNRAIKADGSKNYDYLFENIHDDLDAADICIANNEIIFGSNDLPLHGYPDFNAHTELGDAETKAGFNVVTCATNHVLDRGVSGIQNTINYWEENGETMYLGIHGSAEDANEISIMEVKGIKIAMLNYTYGMNGYSLSAENSYMVDLLTESNRDKIINDLRRASELADFVIVFPHWGEEYSLHANQEQREWAELFTAYGADLIIGTHSHCIEEVEWIETANGNTALCYYSLGNYVSSQYLNISMLEGMAKVKITKKGSETYITDYDMDFLVNHYTDGWNWTAVIRFDDYSDAYCNSHGVHTTATNPGYVAMNKQRPLSMANLTGIIQEVCPQFLVGGEKKVNPSLPVDFLTKKEKKTALFDEKQVEKRGIAVLPSYTPTPVTPAAVEVEEPVPTTTEASTTKKESRSSTEETSSSTEAPTEPSASETEPVSSTEVPTESEAPTSTEAPTTTVAPTEATTVPPETTTTAAPTETVPPTTTEPPTPETTLPPETETIPAPTETPAPETTEAPTPETTAPPVPEESSEG